ncbi:keto-hydroxyglutarate-aldolase/keto-deoxy-phosphogluconate aldolase [Lacrimispora sp.]|uniref:keto-hydroxyglutarate-aldolase/keto-deoxy- phosphogluconate aldolase n=1 Tax=Lacrimispora sp. TaxID=2719234 RepID=UPI002FDB1813
MNTVLNEIQKIGILPTAMLDDARNALPLADALCKGGIPCVVINFCDETTGEAICEIMKTFPQMIVGSGAVTNVKQACLAIDAGAHFITSPIFDPAVIEYCKDRNIEIIPRVSGSAHVESALSLGLGAVSILPESLTDGIHTIQTMSRLYPSIGFIPEGSICEKDTESYLELNNIFACSNNQIAKKEWIQAGEFNRIERMAKESVRDMMGFEVSHIGINCGSSEEAEKTAGVFETMFGFPKDPGPSSVYAGTFLECMKPPHLGTNGHIAIATNSIIRAKNYFEAMGYEFNESSAKFSEGNMIVIYFKEEIGGFAVHILQK